MHRSIAGDHHFSLGTYYPEQEVLCSPSFSISFQARLWGRSTIESGGAGLGIFEIWGSGRMGIKQLVLDECGLEGWGEE